MAMRRTLLLALAAAVFGSAVQAHTPAVAPAAPQPVDRVNPFIGTTNFGTCNPGAVVPNGMMAVVPFNVMGSAENVQDKDARWWSTPYEFHNKFFTGFIHGALSGVGCPDMGSLLTMATTGDLTVDYKEYGSNYADEQASPGYYGVTLSKYGIRAEATATARSSAERYTFPAGKGHILLNLGEGLTNETGAMVRRVSATEIEGTKLLGTFCYNPQKVFPVYFVLRVSKTPSESGYWKKQRPMTGVEAEWTPDNGKYKIYRQYGRELAGDDVGYWFTFDDLRAGEQVEVRMGISYVSMENARKNLDAEQAAGATFDALHAAARKRWNDDLSRIRVWGGTDDQQEVFYTALYHALIHPNLLSDVNGEYPLMERSGEVGVTTGERYTVFSLWDTYRNVHQLLTMVYPERQIEMVRSMIDMYKEWGWMPKWELYGRETFTMEGDPAIPVIVDTWMKGLRDFDLDTAYEAMIKSATTPGAQNKMRPDVDPYIERGYVPLGFYAKDLAGDASVSHALEYYIADYALSLLADSLGKKEDAARFRNRSLGYKHYYDKEFGSLRPITMEGRFLTPFDPKAGENFTAAPGFHEGSAWNYTFYVPHDVAGLARLMGGERKFVEKLQWVFDEGLYDPANEPDIAYAYLFSRFPKEAWRTQKETRRLLATYFTTEPDGIPGNDDTGTMSAWALFTMLGFYPDCPGEPFYTLTAPTFDRAEIDTGHGTIAIERRGEGYIRSMKLGGKPLKKYRISHDELVKGGKLTFELKTDK